MQTGTGIYSGALRKYTNGYQNKIGKKAPMEKMIKGLWKSSDYKMKDFKAIMINGYRKNTNLSCKVVADTGHLPGVCMMDTLLTVLKDCKSQL